MIASKKDITTQDPEDERKQYEKPLIIHEYVLETRAGSPLNILPDPLDNKIFNQNG
jgi:hypothetical protein